MANQRVLHASTSTALGLDQVHPVLIARLDILTDPLTVWTGPGTFAPSGTGDTALDGQIFTGLAPLANISDIIEDRGVGSPTTLEVSGHDLDEDLLRQVVRDKREWRARRAYLWMGLLDTDQFAVIDDPVRIKTGIMTSMQTLRDAETSKVTATIDRDLGRARGAVFRWIDLPQFVSADKFSQFIARLANKSTNFELDDLRVAFTIGNFSNLPPGFTGFR